MLHLTLEGPGRTEVAAADDRHRRRCSASPSWPAPWCSPTTIRGSFDGLFNAGSRRHRRLSVRTVGDRHRRFGTASVRDLDAVARRHDRAASTASLPLEAKVVQAYAQLVDADGKPVGDRGRRAHVRRELDRPYAELNPYRIADGPRPDELRLRSSSTATSAEDAGIDVGDTVDGAAPRPAQRASPSVGIATFGDADIDRRRRSACCSAPPTAQALVAEPRQVDAIAVVAADGVDQRRARDNIAEAAAGTGRTRGAHRPELITAETQSDVKDGLAFLNTFLMAFAVHRAVRRRVHHLQHLLDHRRPAADRRWPCCEHSAPATVR